MKLEGGLRKPATLPARVIARLARLRGEDGSELIEFAFVFPALMAVLTLVASAAMGFYNYQQLANATATAVQYVADDQGLVTDPCATAVTQVTSSWQLKGWTAANFSYAISITDSTGTAHRFPTTGMDTGTAFTCTSLATDVAPNEPVVLTVSYSYNWFPVFNAIYTGRPGGKPVATTGALTVQQAAVPE